MNTDRRRHRRLFQRLARALTSRELHIGHHGNRARMRTPNSQREDQCDTIHRLRSRKQGSKLQ